MFMNSNFNGPRLKLKTPSASLRGSFTEQAEAGVYNLSEESCADGISPNKDDVPDEYDLISIDFQGRSYPYESLPDKRQSYINY